jgi:hypothetical protein
MDSAREGKFSREREVTLEVEIRDIDRRRQRIDFHAADGREVFFPRTAFRDHRIVDFTAPPHRIGPNGAKRLGRKERKLFRFRPGRRGQNNGFGQFRVRAFHVT